MKTQEERNTMARNVVDKMMRDDLFSQWLGVQVIEVREGYAKVQLQLREEMINGLGVIHGGIAFSLADSAFAFACNNRNNLSVALDTSITFTKATHPGDVLTAEARELHDGKSTGLYLITVLDEREQQVALFKGTCFRTGKTLI